MISRLLLPILQLAIVVMGFLLPIGAFWLPEYRDSQWRKFESSEPIETILGGAVNRYNSFQNSIIAIYVSGQGGRVFKCGIRELTCEITNHRCPATIAKCHTDLSRVLDLESPTQDGRGCNYTGDQLATPSFRVKPNADRIGASRYSHCQRMVAPLNTHVLLDSSGNLWRTRIQYDDHGTGFGFLMLAVLCTGVTGIGLSVLLGVIWKAKQTIKDNESKYECLAVFCNMLCLLPSPNAQHGSHLTRQAGGGFSIERERLG